MAGGARVALPLLLRLCSPQFAGTQFACFTQFACLTKVQILTSSRQTTPFRPCPPQLFDLIMTHDDELLAQVNAISPGKVTIKIDLFWFSQYHRGLVSKKREGCLSPAFIRVLSFLALLAQSTNTDAEAVQGHLRQRRSSFNHPIYLPWGAG